MNYALNNDLDNYLIVQGFKKPVALLAERTFTDIDGGREKLTVWLAYGQYSYSKTNNFYVLMNDSGWGPTEMHHNLGNDYVKAVGRFKTVLQDTAKNWVPVAP